MFSFNENELSSLNDTSFHLTLPFVAKSYLNSSTFCVLCLNVRSIAKNFDNVLCLLRNVDAPIDIIVLTETWTDENSFIPQIPNYQSHTSKGRSNQNGGVVVYAHNNLQASSINCIDFHNDLFSDAVGLHFNSNGKPYSLFGFYRSPAKRSVSDATVQTFLENLSKVMESNKSVNCIITGDFNIDTLNESLPLTSSYSNLLAQNNFFPCVQHATRVTEQSKTCIDHFSINFHCKYKAFSLEDSTLDHFPIFLALRDGSPPKRQMKKDIVTINYDLLNSNLENMSWNHITNLSDPDAAFDMFVTKLKDVIDKSSSEKVCRSKYCKLQPWINNEIIDLIRKRNHLHANLRKKPYDLQLRNEYKCLRNFTNISIRRAKQSYFRLKLTEIGSDSRKYWRVINEISNDSTSHCKNVISQLDGTDCSYTPANPKEMADYVNNYYCNVGSSLANKILIKNNTKVDDLLKSTINRQANASITRNELLDFVEFSEVEVEKAVAKLNGNSAPGPDGITAKTIKLMAKHLVSPLTSLFNSCLRSSVFPRVLKVSKIVPIFKQGSKRSISNYRPISLTPTLAKIFEILIKEKLMKFLEDRSWFFKGQYGFRPGRSTEDALFKLTETVIRSLDKNKKILAIFLDLAKAFDTVCHELLLKKISTFASPKVVDLFKSFLSDRKNHVNINGCQSSPLDIQYGVPQGTILGPILFIIYINDLGTLNTDSELLLYADDAAIIVWDNAWTDVLKKGDVIMSRVQHWFDQNLLTLNVEKSKFMTFYCKNPNFSSEPVLNFCGNTLRHCDSYRYLGVIVDNNLSWKSHTLAISKKLRRSIYKLKQCRNILTSRDMKRIVVSLIESVQTYGIISWGGCSNSAMTPLQTAQKLLLRIAFRKPPRYSSELLFSDTQSLNMRQLYMLSAIKFFKKHNEMFPVNITRHNYLTRRQMNFPTIRYNKACTQRHAIYFVPKLLNLLPVAMYQGPPKLVNKKIKEYFLGPGSNLAQILF